MTTQREREFFYGIARACVPLTLGDGTDVTQLSTEDLVELDDTKRYAGSRTATLSLAEHDQIRSDLAVLQLELEKRGVPS